MSQPPYTLFRSDWETQENLDFLGSGIFPARVEPHDESSPVYGMHFSIVSGGPGA